MGQRVEAEGLGWEGVIPIRWMEAEELVDVDWRRGVNIRLLRVLTASEEVSPGDEADERARYRLEAKIDLVLATLAQQNWTPVPRREVALYRNGLRVKAEDDEPRDKVCDLELWLAAEQPQPLSVRCSRVRERDEGGMIFFAFQNTSREETELLERFIFQQHRRAVAAARRGRD